jgi:agmatinase
LSRITPENFDPDAPAMPDSGIYGLPFTSDDAHVVILPIPFEATTSYGGGTSGGPAAVLEASKQVDLFDFDTGKPYARGIAMLDIDDQIVDWSNKGKELAARIIDVGGEIEGDEGLTADLAEVNRLGETLNQHVYSRTSELLGAGKFVVTLGGDHAIPFGAIRAHAEKYPGMGILHLDAHADLRDAYEGFVWSHASIFFNVMNRIPQVGKLVQFGVRDLGGAERAFIENSGGRIRTFYDSEVSQKKDEGIPFARIADEIVSELPQQVYLSWDIDGLDPTLCPSTGTPVPGGVSWNEAIAVLRAIVRSGRRIVGLDLCEVAPGDSEWDANVAARLLYKMIGFAMLSN